MLSFDHASNCPSPAHDVVCHAQGRARGLASLTWTLPESAGGRAVGGGRQVTPERYSPPYAGVCLLEGRLVCCGDRTGGMGEPYRQGCGLWAALSSETSRGPARASRAPGTSVSKERFGGNTHTHTLMHTRTCTHMSAHVRMLTHAHTCLHMYTHMYTHRHTPVYTVTHVCSHTHLHTCSHAHMLAHVCSHTHAHACHIDLWESPEEKPRVLSPEGEHGSLAGRAGA